MGITETWLNDTISDAQTELNNYLCIRSDRSGKRGGGCALYIHAKTVPSDQLVLNDPHNSLAAVYIESLKVLLAVIYRPPDSPDESFSKILDGLQSMIDSHSNGERCPDTYLFGDFNLPLFNWDQCSIPENPPNAAYRRLLRMIETNFLTQMVSEPTRMMNMLDLVLTNRPQYIIEVNAEPTILSDHKLVDCLLGFNPTSPPVKEKPPEPYSFRTINYFKADAEAMNCELFGVDWFVLKELCDDIGDEEGSLFKELIVLTVLQISIKHSPPKERLPGALKSKAQRDLISMKMRRKKLNRKIRFLQTNNPASSNIAKLQTEVNLIAYDIKDATLSQLYRKEEKAVTKIKTNPKFFYSYAKKLAKCKSSVAPLKNQMGQITNDPREKADILQQQYISVFSDPSRANIEACLSVIDPPRNTELQDIQFGVDDIQSAIDELDPYSATPDGDIPAKILCSCKESLALPLWLLWRSSFESGKIPHDLKLQFITPLYKKGNKTEAANYRPVSITSHLIKIFERVMRNHLVRYLEDNSLLPDSQHGFRKNRSCLTQLIEHVDSVLTNLNEGNEVDVIYLDYSKAFDKVDHNILLAKMKRYGITGKVYTWIESFLTGRQQAVVVDGEKSSFNDVKSGVPQGTVLGPVFFILYVIDMVLTMKNSKALTFADDTKLMKAITYLLCKALLQADLYNVTQWSIANNMLLHEDKFVVML